MTAISTAVRSRRSHRGVTVMELILVVVIAGILATISVNEFGGQVALAKRTEGIIGLGALWTAQQAHFLHHGAYAATFPELVEFDLGGERLSPTSYKGNRYTYQLSQPWGSASFYCIATAQLDSDPWPDILDIYEFGQ